VKKTWALLVFIAAAVLPAASQSNQLLDQVLENPRLSFGQAAYLVLTAAQKLPDSATTAQAAEALSAQGWKVRTRGADDPVTLGEYSYLLMQAFELPGGLFYRMFPGPRYAARELAFRRWISGKAFPNRAISGEEGVRLLGDVMDFIKGGRS